MTPRAREALADARWLAETAGIHEEPNLLTIHDVREAIRRIDIALAGGGEVNTRSEIIYVLWAWKCGSAEIPF